MRRGRFSPVRLNGGGGRRSESTQAGTDIMARGTETGAGARANKGAQWPAAFEARKWFVAGTVFLQQSSASALGAHWPLRQHFIASGVRAVAKQSNGRTSNTIASMLTTI
jgi:hypothetical protein